MPDSATAFVQQVLRIGGWKGEGAPATSLPEDGARALSRIVMQLPAIAAGVRDEQPLALFGATDDSELEALRHDSVGFLIGSVLALGMTRDNLDDLGPRLLHAAVATDPESLLLRRQLVGKPFGPPPAVIPDWLDKLDDFMASNCFAGVIEAVLELGKWSGGRSMSDATGISSVSPKLVCGGTQLTIAGAGFGATQPADMKVYAPTSGGCREAAVTHWSDTKIVIQLPADVAEGCVGFVRGGGAVLGEPERVTGELTRCIGAAAEVWARGFAKVGKGVIVSCPPCLPGGQNRIQAAGKPVISAFRFTPEQVEPGGQPVLSWAVTNASDVQITKVSPGGPVLGLPAALPPAGSFILAPVAGLVPVTAGYRLTATNGCGTTTAEAGFTMLRTPKLTVTRVEVVQSIQTVGNTVRLTANRATAVRVFVDSGISDGFDLGDGPNRVAAVSASVQAESLDDGSVRSCGSPWPGSAAASPLNRDVLPDSFNFDVPLAACRGNVRFRAVVEVKGLSGAPPVSWATGSVDVAFTGKPQQEILPWVINDPASASPAPTITDLFANFSGPSGPARAHPFPHNGFTFHPPMAMTLRPAESLAAGPAWWWVVAKLATTIFIFPSFIPTAGDPETCTHELAHAYGQLHVNCGGPAGPYGGLPLTISDPGIDIPARTIFPSGSNEMMTYCPPQWPSVPHWDTIFNSIPVS